MESGGQPILVAFISSQAKRQENEDLGLVQLPSELRSALSSANAHIGDVLPRYMVPSAYMPISHIPVLISGKTDRKKLRIFGSTVDLRQLDQATTDHLPRELNDLEQRLRVAWGNTMKLDPDSIGPEDNFFALGGDSVAAMTLMSVCRKQGLDLTVVEAFNNPTLSAMAGVVQASSPKAEIETLALSMISQDAETACLEASILCGVDQAAIQDIYPCTPTQESLITFSIRSAAEYVAQRVACIPSHISLDAWKAAWDAVVTSSPILRTRLVQLQDPGLQQVVVKESISWLHATDLEQYLALDRETKMDLGQSLARYAIVTESKNGQRYMVWTIHHVLYDGWSEPIIFKCVSGVLRSHQSEIQVQMRDFVRYLRNSDELASSEFWRQELKGAVGPQFPRLPHRDYVATPDTKLEHQVDLDTSLGLPFTMATVIRGAWALVASQYTGSDDVVFGETLTGRDIPLPGVEIIIGPLIATLPIRVNIRRTASVESYLQSVQQSILARTPHQHMGWQNIRKVSRDAQQACEASTGLVIQPEPDYVGSELGFERGDILHEALHFNPYPLMLACGVRKGGFRVCASFDSSLITIPQMRRMLEQLATACSRLMGNLSGRVDEISCLPTTELDKIWKRNQAPPLSEVVGSRSLRADSSTKPGSLYPRAVIPWVCDPRSSSLLSPIGCVGELWLEGAFLFGDTIQSPAWLLAGSSEIDGRMGRVQATGDLVQLQEDGSLIYVGRKESLLSSQGGHMVGILDLEDHFLEFLPPKSRAVVARSKQAWNLSSEQDLTKDNVIVFVEQPSSEEETFELMSLKYDLSCRISDSKTVTTTISANVPVNLAAVLKNFDRFAQDSLPSYLVPLSYVVVDMLPTENNQIDHDLLDRLASNIPQHVLNQIRVGFEKQWASSSPQTHLTAEEVILRAAWAKVLGAIPEKINLDDNFFRLGGDSVLAMRLASSIRAEGHSLTVSDVFQCMRLGDAAKVLKVNQDLRVESQPYKAFSTNTQLGSVVFLRKVVLPKLFNPSWSVQDVYPVTDSQAFDVRATIQAPRTSFQYTLLYLDDNLDLKQLSHAWSELVKTHDILRTTFVEHEGDLFQVVTNQPLAAIVSQRADKQLEQYVTDLCAIDIETDFVLGASFLRVFLCEANDGRNCFVIGLSHALYDGVSLPKLLQDLDTLYAGGHGINFEPFSSYISQVNDDRTRSQAIEYWKDLLRGSSLSILEGTAGQPGERSVFQTKRINVSQRPKDITTANLLTAAWSLVLARRLRNPDVTFGGVTSGRNLDLPNVENVMGPCYQFTPIRVPFKAHWTATDLLQFVQKQSSKSAAYDFLGFKEISRQCTQWPSETLFFDSVVHHQDVIEERETISFAGGDCRIEVLAPHGDAAYPLKAVSFVRAGETYLGVVGSERVSLFVGAVLDELADAIGELAVVGSQSLLLHGRIF